MNPIEKNKQNKEKCLVIESTNLSYNDFQSVSTCVKAIVAVLSHF